MKRMKISLVLLSALLIAFSSCKKEKDDEFVVKDEQGTAQHEADMGNVRHCATQEYFDLMVQQDPELTVKRKKIEEDIQVRMASRAGTTGIITIPVVVHVLYNTTAQNISDAQILSQIDILNKDYSRTNADAANTPALFQPLAGAAGIQFCLAQRDPNGNATNGIVRKYTTVTSWSANGAVKLSSQGGDDAWPASQYLNIWVCNLSGYLGYATYPGGNPAADGVVIRYNAFGNTGTLAYPYNKGRTATHEVGHWLNLYHIWGDGTCGDDLVSDSPPQTQANYGCPAFPKVSTCSGNNPATGEMFMNYMDYTNDACMNMFTLGQTARMTAALTVSRASILLSQGCVPPSGASACNVPAGLTSSSVTASSAMLSWTSSGAASYSVRYKPTSSSTWTTATTTSPSLAISGLTASTAYEFQVQGICSGSSSAYSGSATFTTTAAATCSVPTGLLVSSLTSTGATLSWTATGATSYNVRYKPTSSTTWVTSGTITNSRALTGLTPSTAYEFQVQSVCSGSTSAYSASTAFTTSAAACNTPGSLNATSITASNGTLSWGSTGAASYNVRYKATSSSTWINTTSTTTSRAISGLAASTTYEFQVQGVCSGSTSAYSASKTFTTAAAACNTPASLNATSITASNGTLSWGSTGAASYNVRYKATSSSTWTNTTSTTTSRAISGLAASTTYEFQVQGVCSGSTSAYSASKTFTTAAAATAVVCMLPNGLTASATTASTATLYWKVTGAPTYTVRYKPTSSSTWASLNLASNNGTITGLSSSTNYEFQVQSNCTDGVSGYSSSAYFTTAAASACSIPGGLTSGSVEQTKATLSWGSTGATSYNVRFKPVNSTAWLTTSTTTPSRVLTGLTKGTAYEFQVRSVCSGVYSSYSASSTFTTLP